MNNLKLMETIVNVLREQFEEDDQMNTAGERVGSIPETSLSGNKSCKNEDDSGRCQRWIFA